MKPEDKKTNRTWDTAHECKTLAAVLRKCCQTFPHFLSATENQFILIHINTLAWKLLCHGCLERRGSLVPLVPLSARGVGVEMDG